MLKIMDKNTNPTSESEDIRTKLGNKVYNINTKNNKTES
jgi:hypothetical protein